MQILSNPSVFLLSYWVFSLSYEFSPPWVFFKMSKLEACFKVTSGTMERSIKTYCSSKQLWDIQFQAKGPFIKFGPAKRESFGTGCQTKYFLLFFGLQNLPKPWVFYLSYWVFFLSFEFFPPWVFFKMSKLEACIN